MAKYAGNRARAYVSTTGASAATLVASLNQWTLDQGADTYDVTSFEDGNKTYVKGFKDLKGTLAGFWNDADDTIFQAIDSATPVNMYLYPSADAASIYWYGTAYLSVTLDVSATAAIKLSATFSAASTWGYHAAA